MNLGDHFTAEFDTLTEGKWTAALLEFADASFYQTWAYAAVRCGDSKVTRMVVREDEHIVGLAQIRLYAVPLLSYGVAYVHCGPLWRRIGQPLNFVGLRKALTALKTEITQRRKLMLRLRPPVSDCNSQNASLDQIFREVGFSPAVGSGRCLVLNTCSPLEDLRKGLDKKWRNQLSAAEKSELYIAEGSSQELLDSFVKIHREMRSRKGLKSDGGLTELVMTYPRLPVSVRPRVVLSLLENHAVAGAVLSTIGKTGIYLSGATSDDGMHLKASNLVQWHCIKMLKTLGCEHYDLSGISPEKNPGTYHFKAGLCGKNGVETVVNDLTCSAGALNDAVVRAGLLLRSALRR